MSVYDVCCDHCGIPLAGPGGVESAGRPAVRFVYHPGRPDLKDDANTVCPPCWEALVAWLGGEVAVAHRCAHCRAALDGPRLYVLRQHALTAWQLCHEHAVEFLNRLRTVEPKLDPAQFALPPMPEA